VLRSDTHSVRHVCLLAVLLTALAVAGACGATPLAPATFTSPCGRSTSAPPTVPHVIWIWMENKAYGDVIGSPAAPYENALAARCGLATRYRALTHPSLPNYIAATSGGTRGITDDADPSSHRLTARSIFAQLQRRGRAWRSYQESAPGRCPLTSDYPYAVKHDPAPYYVRIRAACRTWDVPLGTTSAGRLRRALGNDTLPAFAFVTPNLCHDTHDCPVSTGDAWLKAWIPKIVASPAYQAERVVVFLTWDENDGSSGNRVPMIVVSPWTPGGARSSAGFTHYSLLKTSEQLLGITTYLRHAGDTGTRSMRRAFGL
jgi:phospholipase C